MGFTFGVVTQDGIRVLACCRCMVLRDKGPDPIDSSYVLVSIAITEIRIYYNLKYSILWHIIIQHRIHTRNYYTVDIIALDYWSGSKASGMSGWRQDEAPLKVAGL